MIENRMSLFLMRCFDIKVKVWYPFLAIGLLSSVLTGCVDSSDDPDVPEQVVITGDDGEDVEYSDFSAFYAPSIGEQIVNWYANKK